MSRINVRIQDRIHPIAGQQECQHLVRLVIDWLFQEADPTFSDGTDEGDVKRLTQTYPLFCNGTSNFSCYSFGHWVEAHGPASRVLVYNDQMFMLHVPASGGTVFTFILMYGSGPEYQLQGSINWRHNTPVTMLYQTRVFIERLTKAFSQ